MGVAQVAIKLPAGALVALFIILLLQAEVVTELEIVSANQLAGYAAHFGFAEEAATRCADGEACVVSAASSLGMCAAGGPDRLRLAGFRPRTGNDGHH